MGRVFHGRAATALEIKRRLGARLTTTTKKKPKKVQLRPLKPERKWRRFCFFLYSYIFFFPKYFYFSFCFRGVLKSATNAWNKSRESRPGLSSEESPQLSRGETPKTLTHTHTHSHSHTYTRSRDKREWGPQNNPKIAASAATAGLFVVFVVCVCVCVCVCVFGEDAAEIFRFLSGFLFGTKGTFKRMG